MQAALPDGSSRRVRPRDVPVRARVPLVVVDPVQDPHHVAGARAHDAVEAEAVLGPLDLEGVGRGHGVDQLREHGPALQVADRAVVLERERGAEVPGQPQEAERVHPELALVGHVVDREDARHAVQRRVVPVERLEEHGDEAGLPVVRVEDARPLAPAAEVLERRAREEGEAQAVVLVVPVEHRPVVERRVLDEHDVDAGLGPGAVEPGAARHPVHGHVHGARELPRRERDRGVPRQDHRHAVPQPHEGLRQRGGDVGEPARLDEGPHLGRDERDVQAVGQGGRSPLSQNASG